MLYPRTCHQRGVRVRLAPVSGLMSHRCSNSSGVPFGLGCSVQRHSGKHAPTTPDPIPVSTDRTRRAYAVLEDMTGHSAPVDGLRARAMPTGTGTCASVQPSFAPVPVINVRHGEQGAARWRALKCVGHRPRPRPCCSGLCWRPARLRCVRSMARRRSINP